MSTSLPIPRVRRYRSVAAAGLLVAAAAALLLLPWRSRPAALELVAVDESGRFQDVVAIPAGWARAAETEAGAAARIPLILGVRNAGGSAARADALVLSVPQQFRLLRGDGTPLAAYHTPGSPLVRYPLEASLPDVEPGRVPVLLPEADTLWLEIVTRSTQCVVYADSVPEFVPAPPPHPGALGRVQIFYSFEGDDLERRHTGLLTLALEPEMLEHEAVDPPPVFRTEVHHPEIPLPAMSGLRFIGSRRGACGAPDESLELLSILWENLDGGRFFVIYYGGAPRKYMFDLNRDGTIDLEMWDADGTGRFNARRRAAIPVPGFLMPHVAPPPYDPGRLAALPDDSILRLDRFRGAMAAAGSPPTAGSPDAEPRLDRFRPLAIHAPDEPPRPSPRVQRPLLGRPLEDTARALRPDPPPRPGEPAPPTPPAARADPAVPGEDAEREARRRRLLGTPVDSLPPERRPPR